MVQFLILQILDIHVTLVSWTLHKCLGLPWTGWFVILYCRKNISCMTGFARKCLPLNHLMLYIKCSPQSFEAVTLSITKLHFIKIENVDTRPFPQTY